MNLKFFDTLQSRGITRVLTLEASLFDLDLSPSVGYHRIRTGLDVWPVPISVGLSITAFIWALAPGSNTALLPIYSRFSELPPFDSITGLFRVALIEGGPIIGGTE